MKSEHDLHFDTKCNHIGQGPEKTTGARAVPIYQTTSFVFNDSGHAADVFALKEKGNIYTRIMNPTNEALEDRMAALEGTEAGLAVSSGMAAITAAVLTLLEAGDEIVASSYLYGGTYNLFSTTLSRFGIKTRFVDPANHEEIRNAINAKTKIIFIESPGNPRLNIVDIPTVSKIAHETGLKVLVDNTFATPYLQRPIELGADIVIHSVTKFVGGHGTSIGGVILGDNDFISEARNGILRDMGMCLSPFNAWLFLQGLETLSLRMDRHCDNALKVAEWLEKHPKVTWVSYPGLNSHPHHELAKQQMKQFGAILSFGVAGGLDGGRSVIDNVKVCSLLANVGDARTLIIHPASTTHDQMSKEEQEAGGVTEDMIRLSVGLEDINDIIGDLDQALSKI